MVLEATMLVLDTSEYMRNGDYIPIRFEAQSDAARTIFSVKTRDNPESTVGVMTLAGEVKATLIQDMGKFSKALADTKIGGDIRFSSSIQVAALALKHRQNRNQRQRIIVFVGSPLSDEPKDLVKLAKKMKKNNIAVDVVSFGQEPDNASKLQQFIDAVNSSDNSHLVSVPPGPHLLSDTIQQSPILGTRSSQDAAGDGFDANMFGVDPAEDPELALALRMSLEEERQRTERARQQEAQQTESLPEVPEETRENTNQEVQESGPEQDQQEPKN